MSELPAILVLRDEGEFSHVLRRKGFEVHNLPMIFTERKSDLAVFQQMLRSIRSFDAVFITSRTAAEIFVDELPGQFADVPPIYVVGERSRDILRNSGIEVENKATANSVSELLDQLGDTAFSDKRVLFVRGDRSLEILPNRLRPNADVVEAVVYETIENSLDGSETFDRLRAGEFGWACFFSPSAVDVYLKSDLPMGGPVKVATIGQTTAEAVRAGGYPVDFVAERPNATAFAEGLASYIQNVE